jgi:membrane protease YdiL (CAAX protease family)
MGDTATVRRIYDAVVPKSKLPWTFFLLTFAISWAAWFAEIGISRTWPGSWCILPMQLFGSFGPTLAAILMVSREGGRASVLRLLRRGLPSRIPILYLLLIVVIPLGVNGVAYWLAGGRHTNFFSVRILGSFVLFYFLGGSCNEEFGWRGYALDRLQSRWNWLTSALVLGVIWSAWHFPLSLLPGTSQASTPQWVFFLATTSIAIVMSWIYNRTGANLFGMLLLHTFENITVLMFPPELISGIDRSTYYEAWLMSGVAIVLVLVSSLTRCKP